jgi:hypothetical protein
METTIFEFWVTEIHQDAHFDITGFQAIDYLGHMFGSQFF